MKTIFGRNRKHAPPTEGKAQPQVVINLALEAPPAFAGFNHSVEEGLRLAKRSFTEIPGLSNSIGETKPD